MRAPRRCPGSCRTTFSTCSMILRAVRSAAAPRHSAHCSKQTACRARGSQFPSVRWLSPGAGLPARAASGDRKSRADFLFTSHELGPNRRAVAISAFATSCQTLAPTSATLSEDAPLRSLGLRLRPVGRGEPSSRSSFPENRTASSPERAPSMPMPAGNLDRPSWPDRNANTFCSRRSSPKSPKIQYCRAIRYSCRLRHGRAPVLDCLLLLRQELDLEGSDDCLADLVLDRKNIRKVAVEPFSPDVISRFAVDQLGSDSEPASGLADASFKNVAHPEIASNLPTSTACPFNVNAVFLAVTESAATFDRSVVMSSVMPSLNIPVRHRRSC